MKSTLTECLKKAGEIQKKNFQNIKIWLKITQLRVNL